MKGYTNCPCRDCFEISMDDRLCHDCEESGCSADGDEECSASHAYGMHCGDVDCCGESAESEGGGEQ